MRVVGGPSGGALGGTVSVAVSKGIALFSKAALSKAGAYTLEVSDGSLGITTPIQFSQTIGQGITTVTAPHTAASYAVGKTTSRSATMKSTAPPTVPFSGIATISDQK